MSFRELGKEKDKDKTFVKDELDSIITEEIDK